MASSTNIFELAAGASENQYLLHLTTQPYPAPPALASFLEADFPGYQPSPIAILNQATLPDGSLYFEVVGSFSNSAGENSISVTGCYLTLTVGENVYLIGCINMTGDPQATLPPGPSFLYLDFSFSTFS